MRIVPLLASAAVTTGLVYYLNTSHKIGGNNAPPFGTFLSPQHGFWQNAEPVNADYNADLKLPQLKGKTEVYFDDRLVPHVFAEQENDAYFVQGYLHAKFRLWQMELQTFAAGGRASEIIGEKALEHDREFRRLGMVYAAEIALNELEKDPVIKAQCDAYTEGVNAYIETLTESSLPVEYKLIGYKPEKWSNLKTCLFLKYMSYDLAAREDDMEMTSARSYFSADDFSKLYPSLQDSLDPIIPKGTVFEKQKVFPVAPPGADSVYLNNKVASIAGIGKPDRDNGSNNWAVSGSKTKSGAPILCNDPHLGLNLPSLWYEIQLSTPNFNAYGVSFPGAPGVIIGFNDSCAFGFTNGGRDVRDYYEIKFKDDSRQEYMFNGQWQKTKFRVDTIRIKGAASFIDSVAYVQLGNDWCPVMFDKSFGGVRINNHAYYAVRWKAHDPSNELRIFNMLDHAKNYADYQAAVTNLHTPGQNCVFACKNGDIAIRTQGEWPAKWKGQGDFVMPGTDTAYLWQGMIPQDEVPFQYNPERGFVSSANQKPVDDSTYHYYLGRDYPVYRGIAINRRLREMNGITPQDMMALQTDNLDVCAQMLQPLFLANIREAELDAAGKKYLDIYRQWNCRNDAGSKGSTVFERWWHAFEGLVYDDDYAKAPKGSMRPFLSTLVEAILKDSAYKFLDNVNTPQTETLADDITAAFKAATAELQKLEAEGRLDWEKYKATRINHLAKLAPLSRLNLPIGGGNNCINATKVDHGPSWRMVISLTQKTEAYGVYPGGQSGNPGSKFYDSFVDQWAAGKYYTLWMMTKEEVNDKRIIGKMTF
ncbi:MAG TPA: penicillin acylase family protein, partial [Ferruginibacter sp.]|nr:penicillin acylase family protein [Ferruginibacter sp.]HNN70140.1 penicillin acylase family protein [Ferruginibacter sp.]